MSATILAALVQLLETIPADAGAPCVQAGASWGGHADHARIRRQAAAECVGCPILRQCHEAAEARGERHGVWGGRDRESDYREAHSAPALASGRPVASCGSESGYKRHRRRGEAACASCMAAHAATRQAQRLAS